MHPDYFKARKSIVRTRRLVGQYTVEHEVAAMPGAFVKTDALELWTVLQRAGEVTIPGFSGTSLEVVASSYISEKDALAKARDHS